jgi:ABC-2 type transport system ATP-binding protein
MIDVRNIHFSYPGQKNLVFKSFNLRLEQNRIYGLLGKNGTGKSTLLYLIAGLLRPNKGYVTVDGDVAAERRAEMLSEIFLVPEEFDLPKCRLNEYVRLNRTFYPRFSDDILSSCLSEFGLPENPNLQELSMGQKKKVFMSFALATCTKYLLMDEPTNGLDIPSKSQFRKVVAQSMSEDRTLIISTHQVHDVEQLLDHILILDHSHLLLNASVADICEKYTFEFRQPGQADDDVIYAEPSLQGNAVIAQRGEGDAETQLNLELLFNAVTLGKI